MANNSTNLTVLPAAVQPLEAMTVTVALAAQASADTVSLITLPRDIVIVDVIMDNEALGASTTIAVGDTTAAARFIVATATSSAAITRMNSATTVAGHNYKYTAADTLTATIGGGAATGNVKVTVMFYRTFN